MTEINNMESCAYTKCKYLLPCGWCDRKNELCQMNNPITIDTSITNVSTNNPNHEHNWVCTGISTTGSHYMCSICGMTKTVLI